MLTLKHQQTITLRMDNLPEKPWFTYYKIRRYGNSTQWSSKPKKELQYNAEHFWLSDAEIDGLIRDGRIK